MTERALVTGATGFVGSRLTTRLDAEGYDVFGLHRWRHDTPAGGDYRTVYANLTDPHATERVVAEVNPELIVHLGAISPVSESFDRPIEYLRTNFMGTVHLALAAARRASNLRTFAFAGTPEEYGRQEEFPIPETARPNPVSPYAVSKHAATSYLTYLHRIESFPVVISRHGNAYGRRDSNHFVVETIVSQMSAEPETVRLGEPDPVRDFLHIEDVLEAYMALIESGDPGEVYNFGGTTASIRELAGLAADVTGYRGEVEWHTRPLRPGEIPRLETDTTKAWVDLGWEQIIDLAEGLERVYDHWYPREHPPRPQTD